MLGLYIIQAAIVLIMLGLTSMFWRAALVREGRCPFAGFYRVGCLIFLLLTATALLLQANAPNLSLGTQKICEALFAGLLSSFAFFLFFAWGRLTIAGVIMDVSNKINEDSLEDQSAAIGTPHLALPTDNL